jgi:hypothetical protein
LMDLSRTVFNRVKFNFVRPKPHALGIFCHLSLARLTASSTRQFWASVYNAIGIPIAAGVIYPLPSHYRLSPVWASLAMALSSVSPVCFGDEIVIDVSIVVRCPSFAVRCCSSSTNNHVLPARSEEFGRQESAIIADNKARDQEERCEYTMPQTEADNDHTTLI